MEVVSSPCSPSAARTAHNPQQVQSALTWLTDKHILNSLRVHPYLTLITLVCPFGGKPESAPLPCSQGGTEVLVPPRGLDEQE